jgi:hypothetical protein
MLIAPTLCLVAVMYFEARNQTSDTMLGVGQVTMELTEGNDVCATLRKKGLFSWTKQGVKMPNPKSKADVEVFERQLKLAHQILFSKLRCTKLKGKYTYFNDYKLGRRYPTPVRLVRIGDLVFY